MQAGAALFVEDEPAEDGEHLPEAMVEVLPVRFRVERGRRPYCRRGRLCSLRMRPSKMASTCLR